MPLDPRLVLLPLCALAVGCVAPRPASHVQVDRLAADVQRVEEGLARVEEKVDEVVATQALLQADLTELLETARRQGTGEVTLFFPWEADGMARHTRRAERLERWLDHLVLQSRGRELRFVVIASAADWKNPAWNHAEAAARLSAVRRSIDRHLLHVPHDFARTYVMDPGERPADSRARNWRHVRVLAVYDDGQLPELPAAGAPPVR